MDYNRISSNPEVVTLIKQLETLENKIKILDENALINFELEKLSL